MTLLKDITAFYNPLDAWVYDYFFTDTALAPWQRMLDTVAGYFAERAAPGTVLDVGSGGGQLALVIAAHNPAISVDGIDASPAQVRRATRRAGPLSDRVHFRQGLADDLPFPDNSFDVVMSSGSIKHWTDQIKGLQEMRRVLRPGGLFFVNDIDRGCLLNDLQHHLSHTRVPRILRNAATMYARTYVAGRSIDLDDARTLAESIRLADTVVERVDGIPIVQISGRKAAA